MYSPRVTAWVRYDFLSQGKISDVRIQCARKNCTDSDEMQPSEEFQLCLYYLP